MRRRRPDAIAAEDGRTLLRLPLRELLLLGFLENRGLVVIGAVYGLLWESGLLGPLWDRLFEDGSYTPGMVRGMTRTIAAGESSAARSAGGRHERHRRPAASRSRPVDDLRGDAVARLPPVTRRRRFAHRVRIADASVSDDPRPSRAVVDGSRGAALPPGVAGHRARRNCRGRPATGRTAAGGASARAPRADRPSARAAGAGPARCCRTSM